MEEFWCGLLPFLPLLRRVRLAPSALRGFIKALLGDNAENPLLPSLTELTLVNIPLNEDWTLFLLDALMKRVEQGVPLETLDLRMCSKVYSIPVAVQLLSEIVADILCPLDVLGFNDPASGTSRDPWFVLKKMRIMWGPLHPHPFSDDDSSESEREDHDD
jgi:hypothetical protein